MDHDELEEKIDAPGSEDAESEDEVEMGEEEEESDTL